MREPPSQQRAGVLYGLAAYLWWGFVTIYFKAVAHVPATEVLAHRVVWSVLMLGTLLALGGRLTSLVEAVRRPRTVATLTVTTVLIAINWFVFIWAVGHGHIMQASLGYFINPLVNVVLGMVFLKERLRRPQAFAVVLAAAGVAYLTISVGQAPWIALTLAISFGFYGLLRKSVQADALVGLTFEVTLLLPVAAAYLAWLWLQDELVFAGTDLSTDVLLVCAGAVTGLPLIWFANAARRLRLATVGLLQYLAPTCQFLLAVLVYDEAFHRFHAVAFGCIWLALILYSADAWKSQKRQRTRSSLPVSSDRPSSTSRVK